MEAVRDGDHTADGLRYLQRLLGIDTRFEVPVADWTYSELEGNADLRLIRDPEIRRAIVVYYARAHGYHDRLQEARSELRAPLFNELAKYEPFGGSSQASEAPPSGRIMERLINLPTAGDLIGQALTYEEVRRVMWRLWLEETQAVADAISAAQVDQAGFAT